MSSPTSTKRPRASDDMVDLARQTAEAQLSGKSPMFYKPATPKITAKAVSILSRAAAHALILELADVPGISAIMSFHIQRHPPPKPKVRPRTPPIDHSDWIDDVSETVWKSDGKNLDDEDREESLEDISAEIRRVSANILRDCRRSSRVETREGAIEVFGEIFGLVSRIRDHGLREQVMDVAVVENVYGAIDEILGMLKERKEDPVEARKVLEGLDEEYEEYRFSECYGEVFEDEEESDEGSEEDSEEESGEEGGDETRPIVVD